MKKTIFLISFLFLFAFFVIPALSSDHKKGHDYGGHFGDMDLDDNDKISWEEFKKYFEHAEKGVFNKADKDGNGSIDHDEWHEFKEHHGYGHKE